MSGCTHWWRIELANGPTSKGVCLRCGEVHNFRNSEDYYSPAQRSAKAHKMILSSEYGVLGRGRLEEAMKE